MERWHHAGGERVRCNRGARELGPARCKGHVDFVADLQNKLSHSAPGLISAGTFQYGVGFPACVRSGKEGADQMTTFLDG